MPRKPQGSILVIATSEDKKRLIYPEDDPCFDEDSILDLDDPWPLAFRAGEMVWIKHGEGWIRGKVSQLPLKKGRTRGKVDFFYPVEYLAQHEKLSEAPRGIHIRGYFAPANGGIKPDTPKIKKLLLEGGYVDSDETDHEA